MTPRINSGGKFLGYRFFISGRMNPGACILDAFGHGKSQSFEASASATPHEGRVRRRKHPGSKGYHRQKLRLASAHQRGGQSVSKILAVSTLTNRGGCALSSEFALLSSQTSVSGI
ncbi:hypothetical protein QUB61_21495 [Microcoleus sp. C2D2]